MKNNQITETSQTQGKQTQMILQERTMWNDTQLMSASWRTADMLSKTSIIPQQYKCKPGDCLIAIDMANRMGISPIMVMQASQVVQGNFTWRGTACKALIDGCGKFKDSRYVMVGKEGTPSWGCRMVATRIATGETVQGPAVTWKMAQDEGWAGKNGSKWKTMPELMMRYRAASFFAKTECPEVLMGFQTVEEQMDIIAAEKDEYFETDKEPPLTVNTIPGDHEPDDGTEDSAEPPQEPRKLEKQVSLSDI